MEEIKKFLEKTEVATPSFFYSVFHEKISMTPPSLFWKILDLPYELERSMEIDASGVLDAMSFRNIHRARKISEHLIDDEGHFHREKLDELLESMKNGLYLPYPDSLGESIFLEHIFSTLKQFKEKEDLQKKLLEFTTPVCHHLMEKILLSSLQLEVNSPLTNAILRRAVLSALLVSLRQNVGSCFATAPAILIQSEQMEHLLKDLKSLVDKGLLRRVIGGVEYSIPISPSVGAGELKTPLSPLSSFETSPILLFAFEKVGMLDHLENKEQRQKYLRSLFPKKAVNLNVEMLLKEAIFQHLKVSKKAFDFLEKGLSLESKQMTALNDKEEKAWELFEKVKWIVNSFTQHPLLKAWEFTLASFSDYKIDFFKWNLAASLGFNHEEQGGLGDLIYKELDQKLREANRDVKKFQEEYEYAFAKVQTAERLISTATSYDQARRYKSELTTYVHQMTNCQDLRDKAHERSRELSTFFRFLLENYQEKFKEYFQEIYDPSMHDLDLNLFDDSPAGFRLVYKHGRSDPSLWTLIYDEKQYVDALVNFFISTEPTIMDACVWKEGKKEISPITTIIVHHLRTTDFLRSAFYRMAKLHNRPIKQPIEDHRSLEKKPWSYTSGGTMNTLIKCYFNLEKELTEEKRWVENAIDLLTFLLESLKEIPYSLEEEFIKNPNKAMLMFSPTHAFLLKPGFAFFKKGWEKQSFSYTWARDEVLLPQQSYYNAFRLDAGIQKALSELFLTEKAAFTLGTKNIFQPLKGEVPVSEFRKHLRSYVLSIKQITRNIPIQLIEDEIDSFLKRSLPCFSFYGWKKKAKDIAALFFKKEEEALKQFLDVIESVSLPSSGILPLNGFFEMMKAMIFLSNKNLEFSFDVEKRLIEIFQKLEYAPPPSVIFADTNWLKYYFAFTFNPGTEQLELWRMDYLGLGGLPMSMWKQFLNGTVKKPWGIYIRPTEYSDYRPAIPSFFQKKV